MQITLFQIKSVCLSGSPSLTIHLRSLRSLALFPILPDIKQKGDELDPTSTYIRVVGHRAPPKEQAGRGGKWFWFKEPREKSATATQALECGKHHSSSAQVHVPFTDISRLGLKASPPALAEVFLLNLSLSRDVHVSSTAVVILCLLVAFPKC